MIPRSLLILAATALLIAPTQAIFDPTNIDQWEKPTEKGPDKEVPGFLVNLGPTGARAVLKERSLVVKHIFARTPASRELELEDEITGIQGKPFNKHTFGKCYGMEPGHGIEGPMMDLGLAIEESEGTDGKLVLDILRGGEKQQVTLKLDPIGRFSETFPFNCEKSEKLAEDAMDYLLDHPEQLGGGVHEKGIYGLALLAHDKRREAKQLARSWNEMPGEKQWTWYPSYQCIFLSEYHLMYGDRKVLDTIEGLCERLYLSQVIDPADHKDAMHGGKPQAANFLKGGNGHGARIAGYGTMTITTLMAILSWELAEDCGVEIKDFNRDIAYDCVHTHTHESGYMGYRFATGAYTPVGRQGLSLITHHVAQKEGTEDHVHAVTKGLVTAKTRLNDGHGCNTLAWCWALIGAQLADEKAMREFYDYNKAFINLARTHDGAFVVQPGRNRHEKGYYMSPRVQPTAAMAIALKADNPRLRIQGGK
ncbi:MAG: DUF6288 domain-containing protein [Akkermansiaceae bacterium]|nr:DUF6288 domain-containing protein [Akkermansiaceae bacterium]